MIALAKQDRPAPTVSLSVPQAAADLDVSPLSVARLVARGKLKATRLGNAGQWRILPDQLAKYIAAGVPDLQAVELDGRGWLAEWPRPFSTRGDFAEHLASAAEAALLADPAALERIATADVDLPEYTPSIAGTVLAAAREPLPGQAPELAGLRERFPTWAAFHFAGMLREYARQIVSSPPRIGTTPAARLYDSPASYAETVKAAGDRLTAAPIARTAWVDVETPEGQASKRPVRLVVPVAGLMTALGLRVPDVADAAF